MMPTGAMSDQEKKRESKDLRRRPKQVRSVETRNSIVGAAAKLFSEQGYESSTTHQVAKEANVSVGALYRYFSDKEAIVKEIYRQEITTLRNRVLQEFSLVDIVGKDVRELVRTALALAFKIYSEKPGLRRVLSEQSRKIPELMELRRAQEKDLHVTVSQILSAYPGVTLEDKQMGAYLVSTFMEALIEDSTLYRREEPLFSQDHVIEAAADFVVRYLFGKKADPGPTL